MARNWDPRPMLFYDDRIVAHGYRNAFSELLRKGWEMLGGKAVLATGAEEWEVDDFNDFYKEYDLDHGVLSCPFSIKGTDGKKHRVFVLSDPFYLFSLEKPDQKKVRKYCTKNGLECKSC